jgi:hypothetical protein
MFFINGFANLFASLVKRKSEIVTMTEEEITRTSANGETETVRFDDLEEVYIVTTDEGPFFEDLFYVLIGHNGRAIIGQEWAEKLKLLDKLVVLPEFDLEQFIQAMGSVQNNHFVLWRKAE